MIRPTRYVPRPLEAFLQPFGIYVTLTPSTVNLWIDEQLDYGECACVCEQLDAWSRGFTGDKVPEVHPWPGRIGEKEKAVKLKPCPFCGGKAILFLKNRASCEKDETECPGGRVDVVVEKWNTRKLLSRKDGCICNTPECYCMKKNRKETR